jgi:uncharacterized MnhB-related membrane protein
MIDPAWRTRLAGTAAALVAVWAGWMLAEDAYILPALLGAGLLGLLLTQMTGLALDALILAALFVGYFIGNRGFAQLMPVPGIPLLPAEIGLLIAGGLMIWKCTAAKSLPIQRDPLNFAVLLWVVIGTLRALPNLPAFGLVALRDYAMVYYAAFFFITQRLASEASSRSVLLATLLAISGVQPVAVVLVDLFPDFFNQVLVLRGNPLILMKGDLALTFTATGAMLLVCACAPAKRWLTWSFASLALLNVLSAENRASILASAIALGALAFSPLRRFVWLQVSVGALALLIVAGLALIADQPTAQRKLGNFTERMASIADASSTGSLSSEGGEIKRDNNRFRRVWWQSVVEETLAENPVFGLGFGYDLARGFLRAYNPEMAEDFTARSPHNFAVTVFGRTGFVGLGVMVVLVSLICAKLWRTLRHADTDGTRAGIWLGVFLILVSSCFGVVLEGPMGAVIFWSLMGLANGMPATRRPDENLNAGEASPACLPTVVQ